ncbi:MAG: hypothetical protein NT030_07180 [Candidatus Saganbacteria bacterium]|nr:hypothetical protein [Candidatus Saganbacteria bacterium]
MSAAAKKNHSYKTRFSFGSTSAIITNLGLIAGLHSGVKAKLSIISGILVIALADNISDSFGIHIFQESEHKGKMEIWMSTVSNFLARVFVSLTFVLLMILLPFSFAVIASIIWGLVLLAFVSYVIAKDEEKNPFQSVITHILIAIMVIILSTLIGDLIITRF